VNQSRRSLLRVLGEEGSWEGASKRLGIAAHSVRFIVRGLESEYGPLVEDAGDRITLTDTGAGFAHEQAPKLWDVRDETEESASADASETD
jgi:DNA-binding transcriptional LysR family regulator